MGQMLKAAGQRQHWKEAIVLFDQLQEEVIHVPSRPSACLVGVLIPHSGSALGQKKCTIFIYIYIPDRKTWSSRMRSSVSNHVQHLIPHTVLRLPLFLLYAAGCILPWTLLQGAPRMKVAYEAALRACAKGAEWERGTELLDEYIRVQLSSQTLCLSFKTNIGIRVW